MIKVDVKGLSKFSNRLNTIKDKIEQGTTSGVNNVTQKLKTTYQERAPLDWGALSNSVVIDNENTLNQRVRITAKHGVFVEFGTGRYNIRGNGRTTPWVYYHREKGWVTTVGQRAQRPMHYTVERVLPETRNIVIEAINEELK